MANILAYYDVPKMYEACTITLFSSVDVSQKVRVFATGSNFHPSLIFAARLELRRVAPYDSTLMIGLQILDSGKGK